MVASGSGTGVFLAQCRLGLMHYEGAGVPENRAEAIRWYRQAANNGDFNAQVALGLCCAEGGGVPKNPVEACRLVLSGNT